MSPFEETSDYEDIDTSDRGQPEFKAAEIIVGKYGHAAVAYETQSSVTSRSMYESQKSRSRSNSQVSRPRFDSAASESRSRYGKASPSLENDSNFDDVYTKVIRRPSQDPIVLAMQILQNEAEGSLFIE